MMLINCCNCVYLSLSHSVRVCAHVDVCQSPYAFCICVRVKCLKVERKHNNRWHAHLFLRMPQKTPTKHVYWEGGIGGKICRKTLFSSPEKFLIAMSDVECKSSAWNKNSWHMAKNFSVAANMGLVYNRFIGVVWNTNRAFTRFSFPHSFSPP